MEVTGLPGALRAACEAARAGGAAVGLVPTMGALHRGHLSLLRAARAECGFVVLCIFVNPLQFTSQDDLADYPRAPQEDAALAGSQGVDVLFAPQEAEIYPEGHPQVTVDPGALGERLEGASRPGHFRGVLTVVAKLLHLAGPCRAYFGEKDAQQLALVSRMVCDLDFPVTVVRCPTVREADGLAMSSRNAKLSAEQRGAAPVLFDALAHAAGLVRAGERSIPVLKAEMARLIGAERLASLDYVAAVQEPGWEERQELRGPARALVAASFGGVRLIDNLLLPWPRSPSMDNTKGDSEAMAEDR